MSWRQENKQVDRNSLLWKTLRNIEASERFPDLWDQFRDDLNGDGAMRSDVEPRNSEHFGCLLAGLRVSDYSHY